MDVADGADESICAITEQARCGSCLRTSGFYHCVCCCRLLCKACLRKNPSTGEIECPHLCYGSGDVLLPGSSSSESARDPWTIDRLICSAAYGGQLALRSGSERVRCRVAKSVSEEAKGNARSAEHQARVHPLRRLSRPSCSSQDRRSSPEHFATCSSAHA